MDNRILDKIQKLMALATSANEHEAALALSKAQALMAEHNLTSTDLHRSQLGTTQFKSTQSVSKVKDWELALVQQVAGAFGCRVLWVPGNSNDWDYWGRYELLGPKHQVTVAEYACTFLLRKIVKARADFSAHLKANYRIDRKRLTQELDGFCHGWVRAVRAKVHVLANPAEVEAAMDELVAETCAGREANVDERKIGAHGYQAGKLQGADLEIHRPMAGQAEQFKLS
jgi:hypothetical protein